MSRAPDRSWSGALARLWRTMMPYAAELGSAQAAGWPPGRLPDVRTQLRSSSRFLAYVVAAVPNAHHGGRSVSDSDRVGRSLPLRHSIRPLSVTRWTLSGEIDWETRVLWTRMASSLLRSMRAVHAR